MMVPLDGFYALASLDGAPLPESDLRVLGLPVIGARRFVLSARDGGIVVQSEADHAFLGHLDERDALVTALGVDPSSSPAALVRAAIDRFGDEAPSHVLGEWAYVQWDERGDTLTLMASDTLRDSVLFATDGRRVAVAPHIRTLRQLTWVDVTPDTADLLLHMGRATVRGTMGDQTILSGVRKVRAGTRVRIARSGTTASTRRPLPAPTPWRGSFGEAIDELDALLRRITRAQMARHPTSAVMLSGGLDSSIVAVFAAAERAGASLLALTSAAPAGSGLPDEREFSAAVAQQAGIAMQPVIPATGADVYRPSDATLNWLQHPYGSPRHYLYDALYGAAVESGAGGIFDACEGEWSVTAYPDGLGRRQRLRDWIGRLVAEGARRSTQDCFHVRLSASAIAIAERELEPALRAPDAELVVHRRNDMWGYSPSIVQSLGETTTTPLAGLRRLLPLRDRRLLTFFAGLPYRFLTEGGVNRATGRALLAGKVPDFVRLRRQGQPFSPDYRVRIQRQAPDARTRLPSYAQAGVGEWLDLVWLDGALAQIAAKPDAALDLVFEVQATAVAAAFLAHWLSGE